MWHEVVLKRMSTYLSNTDDAVGNDGFESGNGTSLFVFSTPHLDSDEKSLHLWGGHLHNSQIDWHMGEILGNSSSWSGNCNLSGFDGYFDYRHQNHD